VIRVHKQTGRLLVVFAATSGYEHFKELFLENINRAARRFKSSSSQKTTKQTWTRLL
jgi:hypothetical protein